MSTVRTAIARLEAEGWLTRKARRQGRLRKYKPEEYELIIAHFVIGISLRTIAKKRKCSDGTIRKKLQAALGFIDAVIYIIHG
ncbi:TPA: hypothetical protein ODN34_001675 [Escherichia coli]|nr:hypothetical protein [Escherichia coli]HCP3987708.1 hypothetical protein [Escherichia coli]HCP4455518.1 hypothetical protein [Escherichia coli]HDI5856762.1 hypothetical protein [Escherichia coli]